MLGPKAEGRDARPWEKYLQAPLWNAKKGTLTLINKTTTKKRSSTFKYISVKLVIRQQSKGEQVKIEGKGGMEIRSEITKRLNHS